MNYQTTTGRFAEKIFTSLKSATGAAQPSAMRNEFLPLQALHQLFPQCVIMTCPVHQPEKFYVSANSSRILGFTADYFMQNPVSNYFAHIHPDDAACLETCFTFIDAFFKHVPAASYTVYRCVFCYRYRHRSRGYIVLNDEKAILGREDGSSLYYSVIRDVSLQQVFTGVSLEICRTDNLQKVAECRPAAGKIKLSKRESELVGFIRNGFTTKEIAHKLSISHHTVRNIRQKMFEKYKVGNAIELLNVTANCN